MDLMTYQGSCQCGQVKYALQSRPITLALECNCSMCGRAGALWTAATARKVIPFDGRNWEAAAKAFIERRR